jgi:SAM-dependent methyltransferase
MKVALSRLRRFLSPRRRLSRFINLHDYNFPHQRAEFERPMRIEDRAGPDATRELFQRTAEQWKVFGASEPYWSVLSAEKYKKKDINLESFYSTGAGDFDRLRKCFERCHSSISEIGSALELGCGVGRMTQFLSEAFKRVVAVDISQPHLELARSRIRERGRTNVVFITLIGVEQARAFPTVDLFYSNIVLQHNPPPVIREILEASLNAVAPGGYAYFQLITQVLDYDFDVSEYLAKPQRNPVPEMHALPQQAVFEILSTRNFDVLEVRVDGAGDPANTISNVFFARRRLNETS